MSKEVTLDNIRQRFNDLVIELNTLNEFCTKNNISFGISCDNGSNYCQIYNYPSTFSINRLYQEIKKEL